jgi:hypothetical protein
MNQRYTGMPQYGRGKRRSKKDMKSVLNDIELLQKLKNDIENRCNRLEGARHSAGNAMYLKYLKGSYLSLREAVLAHCAQCMGYYADGMADCECYLCPLYNHMPYGRMNIRLTRNKNKGNDPNARP